MRASGEAAERSDPAPPPPAVVDRARWQAAARNDRLLAVAVHAHAHNHVKERPDLRPRLVDEIEAFFVQYNQLSYTESNSSHSAAATLDEP